MEIGFKPKGTFKKPGLLSIIIIFFLLALFTAVSLTLLVRKKGEKDKSPQTPEVLAQVVQRNLASEGILSDSIQKFKDSSGISHLKIDLPLKKYVQMELPLERELQKANAFILQKEEEQDKEKIFFLWSVEGQNKEMLKILFSCQKEKPEKEQEAYPEVYKKKVAIIMDDMGNNLEKIRVFKLGINDRQF